MGFSRLMGMGLVACFAIATVVTAAERDGLRAQRASKVVIDLDGEGELVTEDALGSVAAAGSGCLNVGGVLRSFTGTTPNRYRGDAFLITEPDTVLHQAKMRVIVGGAVTFHFSIHRLTQTAQGDVWVRQIPDVAINVVGDGFTPIYVGSGQILNPGSGTPGLPLTVGETYALALSWSSTAVRYFRDEIPYPNPFLHGEVLGTVQLNIGPPVPDELVSLFVADTGAYAMELCFEPVAGACCTASPGGCESRLETRCTGAGSFFHGQRTTCAAFGGNCVYGACCGRCSDGLNDCRDNYTPDACRAEGGSWAGAGLTCAVGLCEPVTGACCDGTTCREVCQAECLAAGDTYRGDGTDCFPNMCAGACCIRDVGCDNLTSNVCTLVGGTFKGSGTTCDSLPPGNECGGSCCATIQDTRLCFAVSDRGQCEESENLVSPVYRGDSITCAVRAENDACDFPEERVGACCEPDGSCLITSDTACETGSFVSRATCTPGLCSTPCCVPGEGCRMTPAAAACSFAGGSVFAVGTTCIPDLCEVPLGACCFADGSDCIDNALGEDCDLADGRWVEDGTCIGGACPNELGSCCRRNGTCVESVTATECVDTLVGFHNPGATCQTSRCSALGACCTAAGSCSLALSGECALALGYFNGPGTTCAADSCPVGACCELDGCRDVMEIACVGDYLGDGSVCDPGGECPIGACCLPNGTCEYILRFECDAAGGEFQASGVACEANTCTPGACCIGTDQCVDDLRPTACALQGGTPFFDRTCANGACDPVGACCKSGTCSVLRERDCLAGGGSYQGDATDCSVAGLCDLGVCCVRGVCTDSVVTSQCAGSGPDAEFIVGTVCAAEPCEPYGACCLRDGTCSETFESACPTIDAVFTAGSDCAAVNCQPLGACCVEGSCLPDQTEVDCSVAGGVFQGSESDCTASICRLGACCHLTGCVDAQVLSQCQQPLDSFNRGFLCNDLSCEPRGACCRDGACVDGVREADCLDPAENFAGVGTTCADTPDLCTPGACCTSVVGQQCIPVSQLACGRKADGFYRGPGVLCDLLSCDRGACCASSGTCAADKVAEECDDPEDFLSGRNCDSCEERGACCTGNDVACEVKRRTACIDGGGRYDGAASTCEGREDLCFVGACCDPDGSCADLRRLECNRGGGTFAGEATDCVTGGDLCQLGACCQADGSCTEGSQFECNVSAGIYAGVDSLCADEPCGVSFDPPDCSVDALQPSEPDGSSPVGWDAVEMTFGYDMTGAVIEDFTVSTVPGVAPAPGVAGVVVNGGLVTVQLDAIIPTGEWTCITHVPSSNHVCLGSLPGDMNGSLTSDAADIQAVIDCVSGLAACELPQCDADRSGSCAPSDILRVIDLLNGGDAFDLWMGEQLPQCPIAP